jgi:ABC-type multidrug transport system ATPase subunit
VLQLSGVSKAYAGGIRALSNITLDIPRGMFGLLGPNGAGKSTLMRTIATLQTPDSGAITFDGIDALREKIELRKVLGYLPQEFGSYPRTSAQTMLQHFAALKGLHGQAQKTAVEQLLAKTNLWEVRRRRVDTFSGGMKQRFGIAQALLGRRTHGRARSRRATALPESACRSRRGNRRDPVHAHRRRRGRAVSAVGDHGAGSHFAAG